MPNPLLRAVPGLLLVAAGLIVTTACQVVEPAPHAHSEDIPVRKQTTTGILYGAHSKIACEGCHIDQAPPYAKVEDNCMNCHRADRRQLHPLGKDHMPDAKTCGGSGCHSVGHFDWGDWIKGTAPITTDTADTSPPTDSDTGGGTTPGCLLGESSVSSCATACHGETLSNAAPADGTHAVHTVPGDTTTWVPKGQQDDCSTCHPAGGQAAPTHWNCETEVTLEGLGADFVVSWPQSKPGATGGVPTYEATTGTCSNVYCHGYGMVEAPTDPVWSDPSFGDCGSCHGIGPAYAGHPTSPACSGCHGATSDDTPAITDPSLHVNGKLWLFQGEQ